MEPEARWRKGTNHLVGAVGAPGASSAGATSGT
jgi:hypothetical protein